MDWAADLEISSKKLLPRLGRRAGPNTSNDDVKLDDDILDSPGSISSGKSSSAQVPIPPPRTRKTGWGDELKSGRARAASSIIEQERFRNVEKDDTEDDIPVIPDIEEIQEDNLSIDINNVPTMNVNRVNTYKELDTDFVKNSAFTSLDGISLALLTEKLYPENLVTEHDDVWHWNNLFTQISSDINNESQKKT